jgi:phosphomannomutase
MDLRVNYVDRLAEEYRAERALTVAWDSGNGAAGEIMARLAEKLPGRHVLLNEAIDGTFPSHHPDPTVPANLQQLIDTVKAEGCDLGLAFDGDGDRLGVVDGQGRILWGDQILCLLAEDVLRERPGAPIIADVKASQVLFDHIAAKGGKPIMWKTGHSPIKNKMRETKAPLAGEMSGHIFFADRYYGFDDALYAAVRLLDIVARADTDLAGLRDRLPTRVNTPEIRMDCDEARKFDVVREVSERLAADGATVNDVDGVRVNTDDGWWLLRASNTQPVLVARCEAKDEAGLERLKTAVRNQLAKSGVEVGAL